MLYESRTFNDLTKWLETAKSIKYSFSNPHVRTKTSIINICQTKTIVCPNGNSYCEIWGSDNELLTLHSGYNNIQILYYVALNMYRIIMGDLELSLLQ